ncbi:MAG: hypothetical protein KatS3mg022_1605 [Armatimonadota bacterium]|nr:MAG: hypothetical protein KatS3mg022_1605 [Armatimonadota bacterium]
MTIGDTTAAEMQLHVEQTVQALSPCLTTRSLSRESRRQLLLTVELLASVWSDLQRDAYLLTSKASTLRMLLALCGMVVACDEEEMPIALRAAYRIVEGWTLTDAPQEESQIAVPVEIPMEQPCETMPAEAEGVLQSEARQMQQESEAESTPPASAEVDELPAQPATAPPQGEMLQTTERRQEEARAYLSEQLESLARRLDYIENHTLSREEAVPLLLASACQHRQIHPQMVEYGREWDSNQTKKQLFELANQRFGGVWLAPLDMNYDLSEHELETLQQGYKALAKSWQMWRWYEQYGSELDKGTGAPLLESIAAPIPMVQQIWTSKQLLNRIMEQDGTASLYEQVRDEAQKRKWKIEMLMSNSARQRQQNYIRHADEHWEVAKQQVQKKALQRKALDALQEVLAKPNPDTFEEDLLCALVACHQAQIPYSNKQLRELMQGYDYLLENPAIPERCNLAKSEASAARKFLVNLGKQLLQREGEETQQEPPPQEETLSEHNGDLLHKARQITQGKKLFVLCFNRRAEAEHNIRETLQFAEVDWPDLDGGESVNSMEAHIRNADMTVVVVRYSRTHWKEARDIAKQYGKQFVMATKGYGVTHLAQQIVEQCYRE